MCSNREEDEMGIRDWLLGRTKRVPGTNTARKLEGVIPPQAPTLSTQVRELIERLRGKDEEGRFRAAMELYRHPQPAVAKALIDALHDQSPRVRGCAAESLRCIVVDGSCKVDPAPVLEALRSEPEQSEAHYYIMGALRAMGAGAVAERVIEERHKAEIATKGGPEAEKLGEMARTVQDLRSGEKDFEAAFASLLGDLRSESAEVRREASSRMLKNSFE
jgi:thioredoxin-like negative regulator of GroEL